MGHDRGLASQFNALYEESIDKSERAPLPSKRMSNIIDHFTWECYLYIQRGLFERHKLPFALILATKILTSAGKVRLHPGMLQGHRICCTHRWAAAPWVLQTR